MATTTRAVKPAINGWNAEYLEAQYELFRADPSSVPEDMRSFFRGFDLAIASPGFQARGGAGAADAATALPAGPTSSSFDARVESLVRAYREFGHMAARIDPLGRSRGEMWGLPADEAQRDDARRREVLALPSHGLSDADLDSPVHPGAWLGATLPAGTLRGLVQALEQTYVGPLAAEFAHVPETLERRWLFERLESAGGRAALRASERAEIMEQLLAAEEFEAFIGRRYPGDKRFSLEGSESIIPLLDRLITAGAALGVEEIVLGMAHRGRLNVLSNIMGKTPAQIFTEFEGTFADDYANGGGDVKYHKGYSHDRTIHGRVVHLALASNPSHLESVNGVVLGRVRAKQRLRGDLGRARVMPLTIHGDAAMAGQGVVAECLNMAQLDGYTVGGTIHVVINNMIGFTTPPEDGRSTEYCTDVARGFGIPVIHVNGEDPEAVVAAAQLAAEYRQKFAKDIVIDSYGYRKYGHNEQDEASFTNPLLTQLISKKKSVLKIYAERLLAEGAIGESDMARVRQRLDDALNSAQERAKKSPVRPTIAAGELRWKGLTGEYSFDPVKTAVSEPTLAEVCAALGRLPSGFALNPKLRKLLEDRANLLKTRQISYADAESLAFGTLLLEGTAVRLSGQDCKRGTFSHRHAVLRRTDTGEAYVPLNHMRPLWRPGSDSGPGQPGPNGHPHQAMLCVHDSPLSEFAVMGYEYGYSLGDPHMLVMWEGQFGDFCNGAQTIIDQYLASAQIKWGRWSGLVLLLPHGYEGQGPEHSSARLERFLQLCADDNIQVVYPTAAAQIFHLLRRQMKRSFRKPLVVMTPKSLLRVPTGTIDDLTAGSFKEILDDPAYSGKPVTDRGGVKKVLLCTGKIAWELLDRRDKLGRKDVAIVRIEQLYPLHVEMLRQTLAGYPRASEFVWVQEEPRNMGAHLFIKDQLALAGLVDAMKYIGREASATPAVGSKHVHTDEQRAILDQAVGALPGERAKSKHERWSESP
jgi:2-oxoglutarate dehydrogenase E1 component